MAKARKWWVADRRPLKVNVSETEPVEEKVEDVIETSVDTVVENEIPEVETVEEVNTPTEQENASEIKEEKKQRKNLLRKNGQKKSLLFYLEKRCMQ